MKRVIIPALALAALTACVSKPADTARTELPTPTPLEPNGFEAIKAIDQQARLDSQCRNMDAIVAQAGPRVFPGGRDPYDNPRRPQENYGCEKR